MGFLFTVFVFEILGLKPGGGGKRRQEGRDRRAVQAGIGIIGVAIVALKCQSGFLVFVFDTSGIVSGAKGAAGVVALFLEEADFAIEAGKDIDHLGEGVEVGFDVLGTGGFLKEDLGQASGSGLEADLGEIGSVVASEVIEQVILVKAVFQESVLLKAPFEVAAAGPVGNVAFDYVEPHLLEGGDDVFVGDTIPEHTVDHIAVKFRQASDAAAAPGPVLWECGGESGINDYGGKGRGHTLEAEGGLAIEHVVEVLPGSEGGVGLVKG